MPQLRKLRRRRNVGQCFIEVLRSLVELRGREIRDKLPCDGLERTEDVPWPLIDSEQHTENQSRHGHVVTFFAPTRSQAYIDSSQKRQNREGARTKPRSRAMLSLSPA